MPISSWRVLKASSEAATLLAAARTATVELRHCLRGMAREHRVFGEHWRCMPPGMLLRCLPGEARSEGERPLEVGSSENARMAVVGGALRGARAGEQPMKISKYLLYILLEAGTGDFLAGSGLRAIC
mmetsp:Transcript_40506/g.114735  ORF Transcript_40506/g.114735 Transcript_40506/m.114735 type:complete len:127 (-) Transcript_40506:27-407(-)